MENKAAAEALEKNMLRALDYPMNVKGQPRRIPKQPAKPWQEEARANPISPGSFGWAVALLDNMAGQYSAALAEPSLQLDDKVS